jgi:hypothetical protein
MLTTIVYSIILAGGLYSIFTTVNNFINKKMEMEYVKNFKEYVAVLEYHMQKAYDLIHKDRVLIYSLEAIKPGEDEIELAAKAFAKLTLKFLGPKLEKDLINVYGDQGTLIFTMIEYFNERFESDEIRDHSINNMMNGENKTLVPDALYKKKES